MSAWKAIESVPDFGECPPEIMVWNECNGVSLIKVDPQEIREFRGGKSEWRLWRIIPLPSECDIERSMRRVLRAMSP